MSILEDLHEGTIEQLEAKLESAERDKKRYLDAIHRQYQRNIGVIEKMEKAEHQRDQLQATNAELANVVEVLVNKYIANRGTEYQFVSCITPEGIPDYWEKAMQVLSTTPPQAYARLKALEGVEFAGNNLIKSVAYNSNGVFVPEKEFNAFVDALPRQGEQEAQDA